MIDGFNIDGAKESRVDPDYVKKLKSEAINIDDFRDTFSKKWTEAGKTNPIFKGFKSVGKQATLGALGGAAYTSYDRR